MRSNRLTNTRVEGAFVPRNLLKEFAQPSFRGRAWAKTAKRHQTKMDLTKLDAETLLWPGLAVALVIGALAMAVFALAMAVSTLHVAQPAPASTAQATARDAASDAEEGNSLKNYWTRFSAWVPEWVKSLLKLPFKPLCWVFEQIGGEEKLARLEEWEEWAWVLLVSQVLSPLDFLTKLIAAEVGILCTLAGGV